MKWKKLSRGMLVIGTAIGLYGCASGVGFFEFATAAHSQNSMFYIYRPAATSPGIMKPLKFDYPDVQIDGKSIGVLKYNEYLVAEIPPGEHLVNITGLSRNSKNWAARDISRSFSTDGRRQIFIKLRVEYDLNQMTLGQPSPKYLINLIPVREDDAKYEIRNTMPAK